MVAVEGRLGEEGVCKGGGSESRQPRAPGRCGLRVGGGERVWIKVLHRGPEPTPIHLLILIGTTTGWTLRTHTKTKARGGMRRLVTLFGPISQLVELLPSSHILTLAPPTPTLPTPTPHPMQGHGPRRRSASMRCASSTQSCPRQQMTVRKRVKKRKASLWGSIGGSRSLARPGETVQCYLCA